MVVGSPRVICFQALVAARCLHCLRQDVGTHSSQLLIHDREWPCVGGRSLEATPLPLVLSWTNKREPGTEADWAPSRNHETITQL